MFIRLFKSNANKLLHFRNIYVFLASVAEEAMNVEHGIKIADVVSYFLIRKLLFRLEWLKESMKDSRSFDGMSYWDLFIG